MSKISRNIALLATGDEITQGDIINTNSQEIALRLVNAGIQVKMHAVAPDSINEIAQAIRFLLSSHHALIITGGLGPTSDDLTRYALGNVLESELQFDNATWEGICNRLQKLGYSIPPDSNRQQALFPAGARIIPNPNGTAAGCEARWKEKIIFMLPGPPLECLPMLENAVLPTLIEAGFQQILYRKKWLLFGVSEGEIAEKLDALAKPFDCVTGYRLWYPYIEFKIFSKNKKDFNSLSALVEKNVRTYLITSTAEAASTALFQKISQSTVKLSIADHATGGALQTTLLKPETYKNLIFTDEMTNYPHIKIHGLTDFWQGELQSSTTELEICFTNIRECQTLHFKIPQRGRRVINYAVEFICKHILAFVTDLEMQQANGNFNQN
jgi:nicotinamide-nucleotide amidase